MGRFYEKGEIIPEGQRNMGKDTRINLFGIINQFSLHVCFIRKKQEELVETIIKKDAEFQAEGFVWDLVGNEEPLKTRILSRAECLGKL